MNIGRFSISKNNLRASLRLIKLFKLDDLKQLLENKFDYLISELATETNEAESFCKFLTVFS